MDDDDTTYRERYSPWIAPGPYTGRGPRGYQRADERIREEVQDRLASHGRIDASDIQVGVENGVVTLEGTVPSRRVKRRAEDVAESVLGVRDVQNHLRVEERAVGEPGRTFDRAEIQAGMRVVGLDGDDVGRVKAVHEDEFLADRPWQRDVYIPFDAIREIQNGWIVLTIEAGEVDRMGWESPSILGPTREPGYRGYGVYERRPYEYEAYEWPYGYGYAGRPFGWGYYGAPYYRRWGEPY